MGIEKVSKNIFKKKNKSHETGTRNRRPVLPNFQEKMGKFPKKKNPKKKKSQNRSAVPGTSFMTFCIKNQKKKSTSNMFLFDDYDYLTYVFVEQSASPLKYDVGHINGEVDDVINL